MKIEEIEKLIAEATAGPWDSTKLGLTVVPDDRVVRFTDKDLAGQSWIRERDAKFIAESRTLLPKLLAVAKAGKKQLRRPEECPRCGEYGQMSGNSWSAICKCPVMDSQKELREALEDLERE